LKHRLLNLMNGQTVLSGAIPGRRLLSALIAATPSADAPTLAFLDFTGVEVATASFLRESVIAFRDYARQALPNIYPVVANLPAAVAEELDFFVRARGDVLLSCDLDSKGDVVTARLVGDLDPAQRATFDVVREVGAISAPELAARFADQHIGATAWNNRLSALASKGLLIERRQGKSKSFSPLLEIA
jgi:hypothetical protein